MCQLTIKYKTLKQSFAFLQNHCTIIHYLCESFESKRKHFTKVEQDMNTKLIFMALGQSNLINRFKKHKIWNEN